MYKIKLWLYVEEISNENRDSRKFVFLFLYFLLIWKKKNILVNMFFFSFYYNIFIKLFLFNINSSKTFVEFLFIYKENH